ncbi:MAG: secretin N-terminal domain-containing protein [Sulfurifustis sp.]
MTKRMSRPFLLLLLALWLLSGCSTPIKRAEQYAGQDEWMKAVLEYRKALVRKPNDVELRSRLRQTELKAADYYYQRGLRAAEQGNLDGAILQYQQGLAAMPDHSKLQYAMADVLARKDAETVYQEGLSLRDGGKPAEARRQFQKVLDIYPNHKEAAAALAALKKQEDDKLTEGLALTSKAPITLNFRQTDLKQAFEFLARSFGVNVIFDESLKSVPVTLFAKDVTFDQGLNLLLTTTKTFYKKVGPNTIILAPDTKEKRGQYEDHLVRTFQLNTIRAKEMADILKGLLTVKKIIVNEQLNTIVIRDTEDIIRLCERIIENNDRRPAEIILDVEILEVNRSKAEKLGLDFGSYSVTAGLPAPGTVPAAGSIRRAIRASATLSIPAVTFRFFKQDVDAKTLANPKIRVINNKSARIHIGDRVPLRAATIVDSTSQTRTTFDYKDIGIRLTVEPTINLDNSAFVKLGLEVSSLGQNLGTPTEPAFAIGTRNAETFMLLRDGETAILGGLIRDEERSSRVKVPGIGDIPVVGSLFTSYDDSADRTDVLLTITPRVVRGWDVPTRTAREFYSGSENVYSDKPLFAALETAPNAQIRTEGSPAPATPSTTGPVAVQVAATTPGAPTPSAASPGAPAPGATPPATVAPPLLAFADPVYEVASGQDFEIKVVGSNLTGGSSLPLEILYNPQLLSYVNGVRGDASVASFNATADAARGVLALSLDLASNATPGANSVLARVTLHGSKPGISYLVYRAPAIKTAGGEVVNAQVRASRIVIK